MPGLIGKKIGMTSIFDDAGKQVPCTIVGTEGNHVVQVKTVEKDGYESVQLGYGSRNAKHINKAMAGHLKGSGKDSVTVLREFYHFSELPSRGDVLDMGSVFSVGDFVSVTGTSKGKGFQGVVKRHNFRGVNDATHGQHNRQRKPGSIGASSYPSRVFKGMRMGGRYGGKQVTVENLEVLNILADESVMIIKGAIPGPNGSIVFIRK